MNSLFTNLRPKNELFGSLSKLIGLATVLAFLVGATGYVRADDQSVRLAAVCTACHGAEGISANQAWPHLAGQGEEYLLNQLKSFKAGARQNPLMSPISKTLSEDDMKILAHHFAQLPRCPACSSNCK